MKSKLDISIEFKKAIDTLENGSSHVFLTGRAGTGKSTLLQYFRSHTKKKLVVLAPTGVAAINVGGMTIHSFFGFLPDITVSKVKKNYGKRENETTKLIKKLDAIVIDEISMVRADLLDCVDTFLRIHGKDKTKPFGGIRMIMIGDLYQLPPVVSKDAKELFESMYPSPYFFDSKVFDNLDIALLELEKVYRQTDSHFLTILNAVRNRTITEEHLDILNSRYEAMYTHSSKHDGTVVLTTRVDMAEEINEELLRRIKGKEFHSEGEISGKFDDRSLPAPMNITLKIGAQVMMTSNDQLDRWVNGSIGTVVGFENFETDDGEETTAVIVKLDSEEEVEVIPHEWKMFRYSMKNGIIDTETIGSYVQYPMNLAWAVTIHKSQGKTFDHVVIDFGRGTFAHGQAYVALSRCRTLQGIILTKPFQKRHVLMDWRVVKFLTKFQYLSAHESQSVNDIQSILKTALEDSAKVLITYLKGSDVKSKRVISPREIGDMEYLGKPYLGCVAYCHLRNEERVFRVDRILKAERVE